MRTSIVKSSSSPGVKLQRKLEPIWPVNTLMPGSKCPHGVRVGHNRICGVKHCVSNQTQHEIDKTNPPAPENPEDRAIRMIAFFRQWLFDHPESDTRTKLHILKQIYRLEATVNEWIQPTKYRPDPKLKGGK